MTWHPGYASVAEVVRIYGLSAQAVYRHANRSGWRRFIIDGKVRYHRDDVFATLERRTA